VRSEKKEKRKRYLDKNMDTKRQLLSLLLGGRGQGLRCVLLVCLARRLLKHCRARRKRLRCSGGLSGEGKGGVGCISHEVKGGKTKERDDRSSAVSGNVTQEKDKTE